MKLFKIPTIFPSFVDETLHIPVIFTLLVLFQGCFGSMGIVQVPNKLKSAVQFPMSRLAFLICIAYTATSNLETAILTTCIFLTLLHFLRSKKERAEIKGTAIRYF